MKPLLLSLATVLACATASAQPEPQRLLEHASFPRLAASELAVTPPANWVVGEPGRMQLKPRTCVGNPDRAGLRQRIVAVATQEWAWFGFNVDDLHGQTLATEDRRPETSESTRRFPPLDAGEVARVAETVGGYWAAIPDADWIWARQNDAWRENGLGGRWRDPWSAAFISWVMCEAGSGALDAFRRAIAHHSYIDQAIRARDTPDDLALFAAYQPGEQEISPGDLLCSGLRPRYRTLAERRSQLGMGARTHCDIVVEVNAAERQILTIGGNVRSSVRMKVFPAAAGDTGHLAPAVTNRIIFAHLKLRSEPIAADAVRQTPTLQKLSCTLPTAPASLASAALTPLPPAC